jgi:hypothetical protein
MNPGTMAVEAATTGHIGNRRFFGLFKFLKFMIVNFWVTKPLLMELREYWNRVMVLVKNQDCFSRCME